MFIRLIGNPKHHVTKVINSAVLAGQTTHNISAPMSHGFAVSWCQTLSCWWVEDLIGGFTVFEIGNRIVRSDWSVCILMYAVDGLRSDSIGRQV